MSITPQRGLPAHRKGDAEFEMHIKSLNPPAFDSYNQVEY